MRRLLLVLALVVVGNGAIAQPTLQPVFRFDPSGATKWISPETPFEFRAPVTLTADIQVSTASSLFLYNTTDQVKNYERGFMKWTTNVFQLGSEYGGTGTFRDVRFRGNSLMFLAGASSDNTWIMSYGSDSSGGVFYPAVTDVRDIGGVANAVRIFYLTRAIQGAKSKAIADNSATAFVRIAIPQTAGSNYAGGELKFTIFCKDAANQAVQQGNVEFACHNLAGTETCTFETVEEVSHGDGTAALSAPSFDIAAGTDTVDLRVTSDCTGVTPTTQTIQYRLDMMQINTVTPL
jgi:hypothetical protein